MVSVLASYSDVQVRIQAEIYNLCCGKLLKRTEIKKKEAGKGTFLLIKLWTASVIQFNGTS